MSANPFGETNPYDGPVVLAELVPVAAPTERRRGFPFFWMLVAATAIYAFGTDNYSLWMRHPFPFVTLCVIVVSVPIAVVKFARWLPSQ